MGQRAIERDVNREERRRSLVLVGKWEKRGVTVVRWVGDSASFSMMMSALRAGRGLGVFVCRSPSTLERVSVAWGVLVSSRVCPSKNVGCPCGCTGCAAMCGGLEGLESVLGMGDHGVTILLVRSSVG